MSKFFKALEQAERDRALREGREAGEAPPTGNTLEAPAAEREGAPSAGPGAPGGATGSTLMGQGSADQFSRFGLESALGGASGVLDGVDQHLVSLLAPTAFEAEQYRTLRHIIEQWHKNADLRVVAVSSPAVGDGKTMTAINLAGSLAQAPDVRVLLVETDLRRPSMIRYLGLGYLSGKGLMDAILEQSLSLEDVVAFCPQFNFAVLPAGRAPTSFYEILQSPRLEELLMEARRRYDYVVVDTPPLTPFPDCRLIGKLVDGFLLVIAAHKTPRKLLEEALNVLEPSKALGLVFNRDDRPVDKYYYRYGQMPNRDWRARLSQALGAVGDLLQRRRPSRRGRQGD